MEGLGIGLDLLIVLVAAIAGGMLARRLRLPVILGYLAGGVAVEVPCCMEDNFDIDPREIEAAITPKTKAILPVHLYGRPAAMDAILDIAARQRIAVSTGCWADANWVCC